MAKGEKSKDPLHDYKVDYGFLCFYVFSMTIAFVNVAWTNCGNNQTANLFAAKFDWSASETRFYNTIINFSSQLGKCIGSIYGGRLIIKGRKRAFIIFNIISLVFTLILQYLNIYILVVGKLMSGIAITVAQMAVMKHINETIPV